MGFGRSSYECHYYILVSFLDELEKTTNDQDENALRHYDTCICLIKALMPSVIERDCGKRYSKIEVSDLFDENGTLLATSLLNYVMYQSQVDSEFDINKLYPKIDKYYKENVLTNKKA